MFRSMFLGLLVVGLAISIAEAGTPEEALKEETSLQFIDVPLKEAMGFVSDLHEVKIEFEDGVPTETLINAELQKVKLKAALAKVLKPHGLVAIVKGDALVIKKR